MHILFVTGEYPPMQGGVGDYTRELGHALRSLGARVTVLTSERAVQPDCAEFGDGIRVLPAIRRWDWPIWRTVRGLAADLHADWVHVQYQTAAFGMHPAINFAPWWWRRQALHTAWTYHDLLVPYLFPKAGRRLRMWTTEHPATTADLVVVTNEGDRLQLERKGRAAVAIPIGSNIRGRELSPRERAARRKVRGYGDDDLVLAYFGFLNRSKGGLALVKTLHQVSQQNPTARLLMIGEQFGASDQTNRDYLEEVEALARKLKVYDRIQWTGRLPDDEVAAELNAIDVLLMPYEDGASLRRGTLMAGLANGCAIVTTTPQAPLPELQHGREVLFVAPGDVEGMTRAVLSLAQEPELRATLQHNARQCSRHFGWDEIARRHLDAYAARSQPAPLPVS
ncbi:MAG: glycosyltransferase family 4 protein [Caldilinea sp.]|nr:glycosyltransferase family 4 protein [Caldilinea sp.]